MERDNVRALRRSNRLHLVLPARCRSRSGFVDRVVISNLSEHGCRIDSLGLILGVGDMVVVRPEGLEGQTGVIRWIKGHSAGIEFDAPLYPPVVEHLHRTFERFLMPERLANLPGKLRLAA
ncbi:PilZ domain-containing protein [Novosphingobium sp. B 225]|uniref:PilZ domain-containing protein n=1 Tax=Novosphingobium sp. B 225 TaxID=1961849 RepID=UPI001594E7B1|nr:PilZ domain-containing protein [Novosphingobium sp. B 225]